MTTLAPGTLLVERYEIVRPLSSGGMGAVYEARDHRLAHSPCAIKQLLDGALDGENQALAERKFADEMRFLSALSHPGIPRIRDFFTHEDKRFLVMDLVSGSTLHDELDRQGGRGLTPSVVAADAIDVLNVLVYLHDQQPPIIHRDIKPSNLIRNADNGRIRVVDFGIAREHATTNPVTHTQVGTLNYAPLEQIKGHAEPRSDIYALGVTMHHLLTGTLPHPLDVKPLGQVRPDVDAALADIVDRAVAPDPDGRFDSAAEMRSALQQWLDGRDVTVAVDGTGAPSPPAPTSDDTPPTVRVVRRSQPKRWIATMVGLLVVLLGGVAVANRWPTLPSPLKWHPTALPAGWSESTLTFSEFPPRKDVQLIPPGSPPATRITVTVHDVPRHGLDWKPPATRFIEDLMTDLEGEGWQPAPETASNGNEWRPLQRNNQVGAIRVLVNPHGWFTARVIVAVIQAPSEAALRDDEQVVESAILRR